MHEQYDIDPWTIYTTFQGGTILNQYPLKLIVISTITFNGFFLASLISIGQLISDRKSPKTWLFILLFFIFCLFQIHYIVFEIGLIAKYKIINLFSIAAIYLLGPTMMGITMHAVQEKYVLKTSDLWHFVPAIIASLMSLGIIFNTEYQHLNILHGYYYNEYIVSLSFLGSMFVTVYLVWAGRMLLNSYLLSKKVILKNPSVFVTFIILLFFGLALFSDITAVCFNSRVFMEVSLIIMNLIIIFLFLIVFKYPDYYKTLHVVVEDEKQKRWYLKGIDLDLLSLKIDNLINKKKIFMDENLSLEFMAEKVDLSRHQLSQYMNDIVGEKFTTFINKHRVDAAKALLIKKPDENIIIIAYEVGFQSKSTFNASFTKFEKLTPKAYRKIHLK
jgi:AraC-like DNA-binding protein